MGLTMTSIGWVMGVRRMGRLMVLVVPADVAMTKV